MRKYYQASITVEAAFLFPLTLLVIVTVLLLAMYISDVVGARAVVQEYCIVKTKAEWSTDTVGSTAGEWSTEEKKPTKIAQEAEEMAAVLEQEIRSSLLVSTLSDVCVGEKNGRRSMEVTLQLDIGFFQISVKERIKETCSVDSSRCCLVREKAIMDMLLGDGR